MKKILPALLLLTLLSSCAAGVTPSAAGGSVPTPSAGAPPADRPPDEGAPSDEVAGELTVRVSMLTLGEEETIGCEFTNATGRPASVLMIPVLERRAGEDWARVPFLAGFCGVPDGVDKTFALDIPFSCYDEPITAGDYRLSFSLGYGGEGDGTVTTQFAVPDVDAAGIGVSVRGERFGLPPETAGVTLELQNSSAADAVYGADFVVQAEDGEGAWTAFGSRQPAFEDIGYSLRSGETAELLCDLRLWADEYPDGHYRIVLSFYPVREDDGPPVRVVRSAEFSIGCK